MTRTPARQAEGFVLVAVVMFMLALTILGLSLFNLSSFEAQFMTRSIADVQAFQIASGAIERAKFALITTGRLDAVREVKPPYVDSTFAHQDRPGFPESYSEGSVIWDSTHPILIRVQATYGGVTRRMQSEFIPGEGVNYYNRLAAVHDSVDIVDFNDDYPSTNRFLQGRITGEIWWQAPIDAAEVASWSVPGTGLPQYPAPVLPGAVPVPDIDSYIAEFGPGAITTLDPQATRWTLGTPGEVTFYLNTEDAAHTDFSVKNTTANPAEIVVNGTVVWMFTKGFRTDNELRVYSGGRTNDGSDCLILVGKPSTHVYGSPPDPYPIGVWCFGGIVSDSVPIFMASDREVRIEHKQNANGVSRVNYLSIYAGSAWIMPPVPSGRMELHHPFVDPDLLIERLTNLRVLPGQGAGRSLTFRAGTWKEPPPNP